MKGRIETTTKLQLLKHMYSVYCLSRVNSTVNSYSFYGNLIYSKPEACCNIPENCCVMQKLCKPFVT